MSLLALRMSRPMPRSLLQRSGPAPFRRSVLPSFRLRVLPAFRHCVLASLRLSAALLLAGAPGSAAAQAPKCDPGNAGLTLAKGFCAVLVAESLGSVRHLAVAPNGDVFAARNSRQNGPSGGVVVLRDTTGDGKADVIATFFSGPGGSGIALAPDAVYFAPNDRVLRFPWKPGALAPSGPADSIAQDLPAGRGHTAKGIVLGKDGALNVSFGSATNSCQPGENDRK